MPRNNEPVDAAKWEQHVRDQLTAWPTAEHILVPRAYLERALADVDGHREVARIVSGDIAREEFTGRTDDGTTR